MEGALTALVGGRKPLAPMQSRSLSLLRPPPPPPRSSPLLRTPLHFPKAPSLWVLIGHRAAELTARGSVGCREG